jgi:hypothetical protein
MAAPSGENVVRGGKEGGLTGKYSYDASSSAPIAGWSKVDQDAGEVGKTLENGDHFAQAEHKGNAGHPQPGDQV